MDYLFVYGTLAPGRVNHHVVADIPGVWCEATVTGRLLEEGWGAEMGYPGIELPQVDVNPEEYTGINGYVLESPNLADFWGALDEFEGEGYVRVLTEAKLSDGRTVSVSVYTLAET
ncbi:gamma-glutamylcyclotransferase family protein [uncultured Pseudoteredinibacter sp.]|uniref:gamma-glutamylcyclotransferase family protein n=1 Tax=uncultured Pseudoteredinibacter sp. TaxID=1641701 RepID=UPI00263513AB|nr:gamma-glutamylcyclotransferase family protein [uncultured Pseudoteredinibacter sp.]